MPLNLGSFFPFCACSLGGLTHPWRLLCSWDLSPGLARLFYPTACSTSTLGCLKGFSNWACPRLSPSACSFYIFPIAFDDNSISPVVWAANLGGILHFSLCLTTTFNLLTDYSVSTLRRHLQFDHSSDFYPYPHLPIQAIILFLDYFRSLQSGLCFYTCPNPTTSVYSQHSSQNAALLSQIVFLLTASSSPLSHWLKARESLHQLKGFPRSVPPPQLLFHAPLLIPL